jgi:nucleotide-binding universal stress UspA family protein
MTYKTIMTRLELGRSNAPVLSVAGDLAAQFGAKVIGIAACQPIKLAYGEGAATAELVDQCFREAEREMNAVETECRIAMNGRATAVEWRGTTQAGSLCDYFSNQARCADLIVTSVDRSAGVFDSSRHVAIGDVVMQAGRPVLIVPAGIAGLRLDHIMIGWKDTRESRRAVLDAVPLLAKASRVSVVEIATEEAAPAARARVGDVAAWLSRHGVSALSQTVLSKGDNAAQLAAIADEGAVDVIVAGAYGHGRFREWVLGGVTRDLLLRSDRCALVSH